MPIATVPLICPVCKANQIERVVLAPEFVLCRCLNCRASFTISLGIDPTETGDLLAGLPGTPQ